MLWSRPALMLAAPLLLGGCFERAQPTVENSVRPVQVVRVVNAATDDTHVYAGTVQPRRAADLGFRVSGRVIAREVDVGRQVRAGEVLARLDPVDLALAVRSAEADLASARAADAQAQADAARSRTLLAQGWTPAATDDQKQAAARTARQKVISAQAALEMARNQRDYATLVAPADGMITAVLADPGTVVSQGQPVLRMAEAGAMEVEVALPEGASDVPPGARAEASIWTHEHERVPVHLRELSRAADSKLRTYSARFALDGVAPPWLALGMTASVYLHRPDSGQGKAASLPVAALADRGGGQIVWVVDPYTGAVAARPVQVRALGQERALLSGLKDGELVVGLGVQKLDPAARVKVVDIRPAPGAGATP